MRPPSACSQHAGGVLLQSARHAQPPSRVVQPLAAGSVPKSGRMKAILHAKRLTGLARRGRFLSAAALLGLDPCRDGVDDLAFYTVVSVVGKRLACVTHRDAAFETHEVLPRRPLELTGEQPRGAVPGDDTAVLLVVDDQCGHPDLVEIRVE